MLELLKPTLAIAIVQNEQNPAMYPIIGLFSYIPACGNRLNQALLNALRMVYYSFYE